MAYDSKSRRELVMNSPAPTQSRSSYTQYSSSPSRPSNGSSWYSGSEPTYREIMGRITQIGTQNPSAAGALYKEYKSLQADPTTPYYRRYSGPTNNAVGYLNDLGIDTTGINREWLDQNSGWIAQNLIYNGTTNTPSKPGKKATKDQWIAYWLYQYDKSEDQTEQAENEIQAAIDEAKYWTNFADRNLSDEEIIKKVNTDFDQKYPTLAKLKASKLLSQMEMNRAVDFSDDTLYGAIWEARNPDYDGDIESAIGYSALGDGNQWKENPDITARLLAGTDRYSPYSVGSTMDEEGRYFGRYSFDQGWIDENAVKYLNSENENDVKMFNNVQAAEEFTQKCEGQLSKLREEMDWLLGTYDDPEDILNFLQNSTNDYSALFSLDETLKSTKLKSTTRAINYSWKDIEREVRERCDEKNAQGSTTDLVDGISALTAPAGAEEETGTENPGSADEASQLDRVATWLSYGSSGAKTSKPAAGTSVYTETELALENETVDNYKKLTGTVEDVGTEAEKTALQTGKTGLYDDSVKRLNEITDEEYRQAWSRVAQKKVVGSYQTSFGATYEYETKRDNITKQQEYLDKEVIPEWTELSKKKATQDAVAGATEEEYQNLLFLKGLSDEDKEQEWFLRTLAVNPEDQNALTSLYLSVSTDRTLTENALERAKTWYDYITSDAAAVPTYLTDEEEAKFAELDNVKTALENEISEGNDYLSTNEKEYLKAKRDRDYLRSLYETANPNGELIDQIELLYEVGSMKARTAYTDYESYDASVMSGEKDRATATADASKDALYCLNAVDYIQTALDDFQKNGIALTDEQQQNINSQIESLTNQAIGAGYVSLDGAADFGEMVKKGREEALKKPDSSYAHALADLYHGDKVKILTMFNYSDIANALTSISDEEMNRYFYLMGKEGESVANEYLDYLTDPDKGVLTVRKMMQTKENIQKAAGENVITAGLATGMAIMTSLVKGPMALGYKVGQWVSGKEVSPYNAAYGGMEYSEAFKSGSKDFLHKAFGEDSFASKAADKVYDIAEGIGEYAAQAAMMGGIFERLGFPLKAAAADKLGIKMLKSGAEVALSTLNSAEQTYRNVLQATGDETQAEAKSAVSFFTGLLSHAVIMNGIHSAFQANPTDVKSMFSGLFQQVLKTDAAVAGSTIVTSTIEKAVDKAFGKSGTEWGRNYAKYKELYHSETIAAQMADQKMWESVCEETVQAVINSTIRTGITYGAKVVSKAASEQWNKIDVAWRYIKDKLGIESIQDNDTSIRFGSLTEVPDNLAGVIPDDAIVNPVNGLKGTTVYNRNTGKKHNVVAFTAGEDGNVVFYDDHGEQLPMMSVITRNGAPVTEFFGDEYDLMAYAWNYGKQSYQVPEETHEFTDASVGQEEPQANTDVKDLSILGQSFGTNPTASSVAASAVLYLGDGDAAKAAGQALIAKAAGGDPKAATAALHYMALNATNPMWKEDVIAAALSSGNGNQVLGDIVSKVQNGEAVTTNDVNALHDGVAKDKENPNFNQAVDDAVNENRVANATNALVASTGEFVARLQQGEKAVRDAAAALKDAQAFAEEKHDELDAAAQNLVSANEQYDPQSRPQGESIMRQAIDDIQGADIAAGQADDAVAKQQNRLNEAQKALSNTRNEVMNDARKEALVQIGQQNAEAQAQRDAQTQAAADAEAQRQALMQQEEAEEQTEYNSYRDAAKKYLQGRGYVGDLDKQAEKIAERKMALDRGKVDTSRTLTDMEDADKFLRMLSRKTGITITAEDMGDPLLVRERIDNKNHLVFNSNMTTAQAIVGAVTHGITHGLEMTGAYKRYAETALKYMYGGRGTDTYNKAVQQKIEDYGKFGQSLTPTGDENHNSAESELVAEFTRLHLADKKFVRKAVSKGIGSDVRKSISYSLNMAKGYKFKGAAKRTIDTLKKAERLFWEATNERARMNKEGYNGHTGMSQFSIMGVGEATGLTVEVTGDDQYMYKLYSGGKEIAPGSFTPDMVKGTPVGKVIDLAEQYSKAADKAKVAETQRKFIADIVNMIGQYQDAAMVWELAGSLAFSCLKTNGDPQYSDSDDMGTICTKTQAILNVMSETQLRLGRALTKDEIDGIVYNEVGRGVQDENGNWKHGATPCPPCYVYATWVNKPARLEKVRKYQEECKDWTDEQINEFMNRPDPVGRTKTKTKELKTEQNTQKLWISLCLADEKTDPETGETTWTRKENPDICPNEILLDLRRSGDMAKQHPGTWTFMQKGGNAQGKAIAPYSDSRIGETIIGKAIGASELNARLLADARNEGNPDYIPTFVNPFLTGDDKQAQAYFEKALAKAKAQNLKGGQRWQSWSDFRAEWGSDYLMEMLTMQALGAQVQTYTKVPEALDLMASAGFEVNMSLMPYGDGFWHNEDGSIMLDEDGNPKLRFSPVTGINPEAAEAYARKYGEQGNVQPMVVGISDEHIKAALAGDYITFVIPFHGSGGSVKRLQHLMSLLHEQMKTGDDYTKAQSDEFEQYITVGEGKSKKKINTNPNWALREAILTGNYDSLSDQQKDDIDKNEYLKKLYEDRYIDEDSPAYGVFFSKGEAQQIYPYEYWDKNTTLATADENSQRFIKYCTMLGVKPRFSGLTKTVGKGKKAKTVNYANFSGRQVDENGNVTYNPVPGYWKLLIDRPMYNRIYDKNGKLIKDKCTYHEPKAVNVGNINVSAMPMAANNTVGHNDDDVRQITDRVVEGIRGPATAAYQNMTLGNSVSTPEEVKPVIKKAMYADSDEQLSAGGDLSDEEIDDIIRDMDEHPDMDNLLAAVDEAIDEMEPDELLEYLGLDLNGTPEEATQEARNLMTVAVQDIVDEFDPTIYRGKLYVKPDTLDFWLSDEGFASTNPDYAQAYITTMNPKDFLRLTTATPEGQQKIMDEATTLDEEKLSEYAKRQPIQLYIDEESGKITGHEGRHRSIALARAGVTEVPVLLFDRRTKYSKTPKDSMTLEGQDLRRRHDSNVLNGNAITFENVIPLSSRYRDELHQRFTASEEERQASELNNQRILQYSAGGDLSDEEMDNIIALINEGAESQGLTETEAEEYLDETYKSLVESGRTDEAIQMLKAKAEKADGIILCQAPANYRRQAEKDIANDIKEPVEHPEALATAAAAMATMVPENAVLIPMPPHTGAVTEDTDMFILANAIASITGSEVVNALGSSERESSYSRKTRTGKGVKASEMGMYQAADIPEGKIPVIIDNVISSGNTAKAAHDALGRSDAIVLGYARGKAKNVVKGLKNLAITSITDADGNKVLIPFSERMDVDNPDYNHSLGGELSDVEIDQFLVESGMISPEMIPYSYVPSVYTQNGNSGPQRQFGSKTAQESDALHQQVKDYLFNHSEYIPDTNEAQINRALGWVRSKASDKDPDGYLAALDEVTSENFDYRSADGQARMLTVMGMAALKAEQGDPRALEDELKLADAFNKQGTDLGRQLQARKLFRLMTPVGRMSVLEREAERVNQGLADKGRTYRVSLPQDVLEQAANARTEEDFADALRRARQVINEQIPVTWGERILAWRMLSMLSAPKTHIRNILGNVMMVPVVGLKNKVAAAIEIGAQASGKLDKSERTKTIGFANPEARAFAKDCAEKFEGDIRGDKKYKEGGEMKQDRKIFGTKDGPISKTVGKVLQKWYDANGKALEFEDWLFLKGHFQRALSGYMTARGLKPDDMKGQVLEDACVYAINEARKATYRDSSPVASKLNKIRVKGKDEENSKGLAVLQWIVNTRLPFKKTPINIAKRGIEYSPVGLGKSLTYDALHLKQYLDWKNGKLKQKPKSAISPTEFIDKFASGLTGTGIMIAGIVAAALGLARAGFNKDDPDDAIAKMAGEQEYSIRPGKLGAVKWINQVVTNIGKNFDPEFEFELIGEDVSMTLDWAAPVCLPFFTGVALKEHLEKNGFSIGGIFDLAMEVTDPMLNMSFLEGISEMFNGNNYSSKDSLWTFVEKTGLSFLTSMVPTLSGQIANTIDPTRKTTYLEPGTGTGDKDIDKTLQQIRNKIPFLSMSGVPYTNMLGEEPEHVIAPFFENLLSPSYFSKVDESDEMKELARLYSSTRNKSILPSDPGKTIRVNGEDVSLNGMEHNQLLKEHGSVWRETITDIMDNPLYLAASEDSKVAIFKLADSYAKQIAKRSVNEDYKVDSWVDSAYSNKNAGDAIINKVAEANKKYYVQDKTKSFAEAMFTGNRDDIITYTKELQEAKADPSTVRKGLTAYFKPLYIDAYQNNDRETMYQIRDILTNIGTYLHLERPITKYTPKKDFNKWITSPNTTSDEDEDSSMSDWLGQGDNSGGLKPLGTIASETGAPGRSMMNQSEDEYYDENEDEEVVDDLGQYGAGNIDLYNRIPVVDEDGYVETVKSFSTNIDGKEVLLPTVIDGRIVSEEEAIDHYYETGEYLGIFDTPEDATKYAIKLHKIQEKLYPN